MNASNSSVLPPTLEAAHAEIERLRAALAAEHTLARIPAQNPNPVYRLGPDRQRLFANEAADRLAQEIEPEELERNRTVVYGWVAEALAAGTSLRRNLTMGQRHFTAFLSPCPEEHYVNLYLLEITDQVQTQEHLASQQIFVQQVLDTVPMLVYVREEAGEYVFRNQAAIQLGEQMQHSPPEVLALQYQQMQLHEATDQQVLRTRQELVSEGEVVMPDGNRRFLHVVKRPLQLSDGRAAVLGVSTDVTDIRQATNAAKAAAKARENFLANMSHEIRTPLNGVLGMANQLSKTRLDARQQELVNIIRSSGHHLLGVINDVLDMAKINSGKLELAAEPFNVCDSMGLALQPLAHQATEKGIVFEAGRLRDSCPMPWVVGDAHRLNQVMINLVSNAIKFTPAGGRISAGGYLISETADTLSLEFRVTDTGIGISPEKQARVFDSFTQAYADTTRKFGGTGLGLSISRALVEQMGGEFSLRSEVGQGSTFSFAITLPRAQPQEAEPESATTGSTYDTGVLRERRMLLVEDNEINRAVARLLLEEWGVQLDEAEDGYVGLKLASQQRYDVILMDIQMPGMSGLEATAAIRALPDPALAQVPVVALTANAFREDTEHYLAAGLNACVAKPFDEVVLFEQLAALLTPLPYDLSGLRRMSRGKEAFVHGIIRSFLTNAPDTVAQLRTATDAQDWSGMARLAHHLKPNLTALGVTAATPLVAELETLRLQPPVDAAAPQLAALALTELVDQVLLALPAELPASV